MTTTTLKKSTREYPAILQDMLDNSKLKVQLKKATQLLAAVDLDTVQLIDALEELFIANQELHDGNKSDNLEKVIQAEQTIQRQMKILNVLVTKMKYK